MKKNKLYKCDYNLIGGEKHTSYIYILNDGYIHFLFSQGKQHFEVYMVSKDWKEIEDDDYYDDYGTFDNFKEHNLKSLFDALFSGIKIKLYME
jgi:hypothetical protein